LVPVIRTAPEPMIVVPPSTLPVAVSVNVETSSVAPFCTVTPPTETLADNFG
jgi:hypothetical protein